MSELPATMKAVVFNGPNNVSVEERPVPKLQGDGDILVKVQITALCGSDLHLFRGIEPSGTGYIMGHEFAGTVVELGSAVKQVAKGDKVVCPFTVSCGECFFCKHKASSRCVHSMTFGSERLDGAQAEYVRVPFADSSVVKAPPAVSDQALVLMADILPTGYFGVKSAIEMCATSDVSESTIVVVGCGPVGLCAVISALHAKARRVFAIDSVDSRLELARKLGAEPLNFKTDPEGMKARVLEATEGRGADMAVEVVGLPAALKTAYDLVRHFGAISSIGVHNAQIPWSGTDGYNKNIRLQMGRCPVRSVFPEALAVLVQNQDSFNFMFDQIMPLADAVEGYDLFNQMKVQKVVFTP